MDEVTTEMWARLATLSNSEKLGHVLDANPHVHIRGLCIRSDGQEPCAPPVTTRKPIAQHARQSTAYSIPAAVFWFLAGAAVGATTIALVAAHHWGVL